MKLRFGERFIDAGLIGAECAATLQQQSDAFEGRPVVNSMRFAVSASSPVGLRDPVHLPPPLTGSRSKTRGGCSYRLVLKFFCSRLLGLRLGLLNAPYP